MFLITSEAQYTYSQPGIYEAQFWVENNFNETSFASQQIKVKPQVAIYDLDANGIIEMDDLLEFIECSYKNDLRGDFNKDGKIDSLDLFKLSQDWGVTFDIY